MLQDIPPGIWMKEEGNFGQNPKSEYF